MRVLKGIGFLALSAALLVVSCGHAQNAKEPSQADSLSPLPTTIPALTGPELERYSLITGRFFDSMLAGRFNGSMLVAKNGVVLYERYKGFENPRMRKDSLDGTYGVSSGFDVQDLYRDGDAEASGRMVSWISMIRSPNIWQGSLIRSNDRNAVEPSERAAPQLCPLYVQTGRGQAQVA